MVQNALHCDVFPGRFLIPIPLVLRSNVSFSILPAPARWLEKVVSSAKERRVASNLSVCRMAS